MQTSEMLRITHQECDEKGLPAPWGAFISARVFSFCREFHRDEDQTFVVR